MVEATPGLVVPCAVAAPLLIWVWALTGYAPRLIEYLVARVIRAIKCGNKKKFNFTEIEEHLYLGSLPRKNVNLQQLKEAGIKAVVTLNQKWELDVPMKEIRESGLHGLRINVPDYSAPYQKQIRSGVEWMQKEVSEGNPVYVHCNGGKGRSAVVVICFLMVQHGMSADAAFEYVRSKRKIAKMKLGRQGTFHKQWRSIRNFELGLNRNADKDASSSSRGTKKIVPTMEDEQETKGEIEQAPAAVEQKKKAPGATKEEASANKQDNGVNAEGQQGKDAKEESSTATSGAAGAAAAAAAAGAAGAAVAEGRDGGGGGGEKEVKEAHSIVSNAAAVDTEKAANQGPLQPPRGQSPTAGAPIVLPPVKPPGTSTPRK
jgi:atypical dual specificity phosphatase